MTTPTTEPSDDTPRIADLPPRDDVRDVRGGAGPLHHGCTPARGAAWRDAQPRNEDDEDLDLL